jgi:hypothetical protein
MLKELLELSRKVLERWNAANTKVADTRFAVAMAYSTKCLHLFEKYHETIEEIFKYSSSSFKIGSPIMWLDGELTIKCHRWEYAFKMSTNYEVVLHDENSSLKTLGYQFKAVQSGGTKSGSSGRQVIITEKIVQHMTDEWFEKALAAELKRRMKAKDEETCKLLREYGLK